MLDLCGLLQVWCVCVRELINIVFLLKIRCQYKKYNLETVIHQTWEVVLLIEGKQKTCRNGKVFAGIGFRIQQDAIYHNDATKPITDLTDVSRAVVMLCGDISDRVQNPLLELQIVISSHGTLFSCIYQKIASISTLRYVVSLSEMTISCYSDGKPEIFPRIYESCSHGSTL